MASYEYTAINPGGQTLSGKLSVRNKTEAYRELEAKGLHPVRVKELAEGAAESKRKPALFAGRKEAAEGPIKLNRPLLIHFTEELADLLDAGIQLEQALRVLHERQRNPAIRRVAATLRDEVRDGTRFSAALKKASPSFDELYCSLVAAGEASGSLTEILRRLGLNLKQMHDLQNRVVGAMIYPSVLMVGCVVLIFVFSTVLMPKLMQLISKTGQELPLVTELLMRFSNFMASWWWLLLVVAAAALLTFRAYVNTENGRLWWDRFRLKAPVFGPVISGRLYAGFCHTMANLVNNGVPLLNALKLMARGATNLHVKNILSQAVLDVGEGTSLAKALGRSSAFPEALLDRIAIGEQSGEVGKSFLKSARKYDEELDIRIKRLVGVLPMVVLGVMGVVVGFVAYSIMTTIFGSMSGISGR